MPSRIFSTTQDEEPFLQKNYVFVQVSTQPQPEDWIDVMIDPGRDAPG